MGVFAYILRRLVYMAVILLLISVVSFIIIELPPGDFLTYYIANMQSKGILFDDAEEAALRKLYGLDVAPYLRFFKWFWRMLHLDFGVSMSQNRPVKDLLAETLPLTIAISLLTLIFTYCAYASSHSFL